jgi:hypothetical protein
VRKIIKKAFVIVIRTIDTGNKDFRTVNFNIESQYILVSILKAVNYREGQGTVNQNTDTPTIFF